MASELYAMLNGGRIVALTDRKGLEAFKPEFRDNAILIDSIQVPDIRRYLSSRGGLSSEEMPTQYL